MYKSSLPFTLLLLLLVLLCWTNGLVQKSAIGGRREELISIAYNSEKTIPMTSIRRRKHGTRITKKSQGDHKDLKESARSDNGTRSMSVRVSNSRRMCTYTTLACRSAGGACMHYKDSCSSTVMESNLCGGYSCKCCKLDGLSWDRYYRAANIAAFASVLAQNYSHVKLLNLGHTYERRPLQALVFSHSSKRNKRHYKMVNNAVKQKKKSTKQRQRRKITNEKFNNKNKPVIILEAGCHAREWISPAVATYIAQQLAESGSGDLLKHATWVVVPLCNPDGYDYTHTHDRYWRKNRRPNEGSPKCPGVDLNRNFKFKWATTGSSTHHCSEVYHGEKAFSEKETKAMKKLLKKFKNVKLYMSLHCYGQVLLYPWGYSSDEPPNVDNLKTIGNAFSEHISNSGGRTYAVEQSGALTWALAGGASDDYALSRGIPYSYTVELPDKKGIDGFDTPPEKILSISHEIWTGLRCLLGDLVPDAKPLC